MNTLIMKFGGSTIGTTTALSQVLSIVLYEQTRWDNVLLVVSALDGVTDALIEATHLAQLANRRGYRRITATLRTRHLALIEKLPLGAAERAALQADIDTLLYDMLNICQGIADNTTAPMSPATIDAVIGVGEKVAARIIATLLRQNNVRGVAIDTTDLIVTNEVFGNATPDLALTRARIQQNLLPMLARDIIPVLTGFIAGTQSGKPTTLGRGGSDYTASVLAACIQASEVWIWTDVDGIMSADPREIPQARVIPELAYAEMAELAYFGARVLHARMIIPLRDSRIPLRVKNVYKPQQPGTHIHQQAPAIATLKAVTVIQGIALSAERSGSLAGISTLVDDSMFQIMGAHAEVMLGGQASFQTLVCFVIPTSAGPDAIHALQTTLAAQLAEHPDYIGWLARPVAILTVVGAELNRSSALISRIMQALDGIRLLTLSQSPAGCSLSVIVEPKDADSAIRQLHALIVG